MEDVGTSHLGPFRPSPQQPPCISAARVCLLSVPQVLGKAVSGASAQVP